MCENMLNTFLVLKNAGANCKRAISGRIYTSRLSFSQWAGPTQMHFPPQRRKSAWHTDITNGIWPLHLYYQVASSGTRAPRSFFSHYIRPSSHADGSYTLWQPPLDLHLRSNSCTLWQPPPPFSMRQVYSVHFGKLHRFRQQLHTLATSTCVFDDSDAL